MLVLVLVEAGLRQTEHRYLLHPYIDFPDHYFVEDSELGVDMAANFQSAEVHFRGPSFTTFTNRYGCFDHEQSLEDDYILIVGDSETWGYAPLEAKWTTLLEEATGRQTLKCGVSGTGPAYQLVKARKVIEYSGKRPGMIIVLYNGSNDFNDDVVFPGYALSHGQRVNNLKSLDLRSGVLERYTSNELEGRYEHYLASISASSIAGKLVQLLKRNSVLVALLLNVKYEAQTSDSTPVPLGPLLSSRYGFYLWGVDTDVYPWVLLALEEHTGQIMALKGLADRYDADFVLFSILGDQGLQGRFKAMLTEELPYYLDVGERVMSAANGQRTSWRYNNHWNILGNRLAADAMYRYLQEVGIL